MKGAGKTKTASEVQFPEYDEHLVMPSCGKLRQLLIDQKIIGKRKFSYFYINEDSVKKQESGLMFDFEEVWEIENIIFIMKTLI